MKVAAKDEESSDFSKGVLHLNYGRDKELQCLCGLIESSKDVRASLIGVKSEKKDGTCRVTLMANFD